MSQWSQQTARRWNISCRWIWKCKYLSPGQNILFFCVCIFLAPSTRFLKKASVRGIYNVRRPFVLSARARFFVPVTPLNPPERCHGDTNKLHYIRSNKLRHEQKKGWSAFMKGWWRKRERGRRVGNENKIRCVCVLVLILWFYLQWWKLRQDHIFMLLLLMRKSKKKNPTLLI